MNRTLYFGPPKGFYDPRTFNEFALMEVPRKLAEIGSNGECNTERASGKGDVSSANPEEGITYHYPAAGIGLFYQQARSGRCIVNLIGTRQRMMDAIMEFIFERDN